MAVSFSERLRFIQKLPALLRATSDDLEPCPGYLFEEAAKISLESPGSCHCLLEFLMDRLKSASCSGKLKTLKLCRHLLCQGSTHFAPALRQHASLLQQTAAYSSVVGPLADRSLDQKVRSTAADLASALFGDDRECTGKISASSSQTHAGMGYVCPDSVTHSGSFQGFGHEAIRQGDGLIDRIQKAAETFASGGAPSTSGSSLPFENQPSTGDYKPVTVARPASSTAEISPKHIQTKKAVHKVGMAGGGWNDSSRNVGGGKRMSSGFTNGTGSCSDGETTGSHCSSSDALGDSFSWLALSECQQEESLVLRTVAGSQPFLSAKEGQNFSRECSRLNCEGVARLLAARLLEASGTVQMRAMAALFSLLTSDLLSPEALSELAGPSLQRIAVAIPGPPADRAIKILQQLSSLGDLTHKVSGFAEGVESDQSFKTYPLPNATECAVPWTLPRDPRQALKDESHVDSISPADGSVVHRAARASVGEETMVKIQESTPNSADVILKGNEDAQEVCVEPKTSDVAYGEPSLFDGMDICVPLETIACGRELESVQTYSVFPFIDT
uniref:TEPSIN adaptor related protein complex 4 accessory protein n=2 Tax=Eptatretus burgeri TaxID=7764 RepID=A0A8C4NCL6_EPTBU